MPTDAITDPELPDLSIVDRRKGNKATAIDWHRRLGHLNGAAMKKLLLAEQIEGGKVPDLYAMSVPSPNTRSRYTAPATRRNKPLKRIHAGLCGPFATHSVGGSA